MRATSEHDDESAAVRALETAIVLACQPTDTTEITPKSLETAPTRSLQQRKEELEEGEEIVFFPDVMASVLR